MSSCEAHVTHVKNSPDDSSKTRLKFLVMPMLVALRWYWILGSPAAYLRHISCVESSEALSEMINSNSSQSCASGSSKVWRSWPSQLYTGSPMLTKGLLSPVASTDFTSETSCVSGD
ncbi:hypothetical protein BH20ACT11_BH20ACT11_00300 [soil metagenome]